VGIGEEEERLEPLEQFELLEPFNKAKRGREWPVVSGRWLEKGEVKDDK